MRCSYNVNFTFLKKNVDEGFNVSADVYNDSFLKASQVIVNCHA